MLDSAHVPSPTGDAVVFRLALGRMFIVMLVTGAVSWILVVALVLPVTMLLWGDFIAWLLVLHLANAVTFAVSFATFSTWSASRRRAWIRSSAAGLELASSGANPVFMPWPAVVSVNFRWRGALTILEVTPTDLDHVATASTGGRRPRTRRRAGRRVFVVEVGLMQPGPEAVRAELARRLPHPAQANE